MTDNDPTPDQSADPRSASRCAWLSSLPTSTPSASEIRPSWPTSITRWPLSSRERVDSGIPVRSATLRWSTSVCRAISTLKSSATALPKGPLRLLADGMARAYRAACHIGKQLPLDKWAQGVNTCHMTSPMSATITANVKAILAATDGTAADFFQLTGIPDRTGARRMAGVSDWTLPEIDAAARVLGLDPGDLVRPLSVEVVHRLAAAPAAPARKVAA